MEGDTDTIGRQARIDLDALHAIGNAGADAG